MKRLLLLVIVITCQIFGQSINKKWIEVIQLPDQKVYVDTSTIKQLEGQISCLCISYFSTPRVISSLNAEAYSVKSQVLFNLATQKYTTVGTLYYDKKLKILGQSSIPGLSISGEAFATPIDSNQVMVAVYAYCLNYINKGERLIENEDFSHKSEKIKSLVDNKIKTETEKKSSGAEISKRELIVDTKKSNKQISVGDNSKIELEPKNLKPAPKDSSIKIVDLPIKKNDALKSLTEKKNLEPDGEVEVLPRSAIFRDGEKYSFQVSSWKNKAKAESEVSRLKSQGHKAFVVEAYIPERRGTWYRVRIGYFNSLEETEAYMKKLKQ